MKICKTENCDRSSEYRDRGHLGYCGKHYQQIWKFGKTKRTIHDKNEIIIKKYYAEMFLYFANGVERTRTKIDIKNIDLIKQYKWSVSSNGYVWCSSLKKYLHSFLLKTKIGLDTDHVNENKLDNRMKNLREATRTENNCNKKQSLGLTYRKKRKKWLVQISYKLKHYNLGYYADKKEAIKVRRKAELKYFGEFAPKR